MSHDLVFSQSSGCLYLADENDARCLLARGYAGSGTGLNNPKAERQIAIGPIPRGLWSIDDPIRHARLGPLAFALYPVQHRAHGRSGFFIHGDNERGDRSASTGCIVVPRGAREVIRALAIKGLLVVE